MRVKAVCPRCDFSGWWDVREEGHFGGFVLWCLLHGDFYVRPEDVIDTPQSDLTIVIHELRCLNAGKCLCGVSMTAYLMARDRVPDGHYVRNIGPGGA